VAVAALLGLTYVAHSGVSTAKKQQAAAEAQLKQLQNEKARLAPVNSSADPTAALATTTEGMLGADVEWRGLVDHVGNDLPSGVWLTQFQAQQTVPAPNAKPVTPSSTASTSGSSGGPANYAGAVATARNGAANASAAANNLAANAGSANPGGAGNAAAKGVRPVTPIFAGCVPLTGTISMTGIATTLPAMSQFLDKLAKDSNVSSAWIASAQKSKFGGQDMIVFTANATLADGAHSTRIAQFVKGASCR
jgi:hypothetical protein